ncbi:MAG: hypothetical protein EKK31_11775 [Hyphomicrobiales bacterium]|nr:MAG: hypothetical protein EKK31_11775 [Hyphomicrobiales bacterium]
MISGVLLLHGLTMDSRRQKRPDWRETESLSDAASRLLRVLDERKKRRLAGAETPAEIQQSRTYVPAYPGENGREASAKNGSAALKPPGQLTPQREECGDHTLEGGNGRGLETDGRAEFSTLDFVQSFSPQGTARPGSGRYLGRERTRERHAPEDEVE